MATQTRTSEAKRMIVDDGLCDLDSADLGLLVIVHSCSYVRM